MGKIQKISENANFTAVNVGSLDNLSDLAITHPVSGEIIRGKAFLKDVSNATGTEISYNVLPPNTDLPYFHTHNKNEETYLILKGSGKFQVDDQFFDITEGSVIRISPAGKRGMTNTSDEAMVYIVIQSKQNSLEEYSATDGNIVEYAPLWKDQ